MGAVMIRSFFNLMPLFDLMPLHVCIALCTGDDWQICACNDSLRQLIERLSGRSSSNGLSLRDWLAHHTSEQSPTSESRGHLDIWLENVHWRLDWQQMEQDEKMYFILLQEEREKADMEAVERFSQELYTLMDSLHDGIWVIDGKGTTLHVNKALKRIAGIEPSEMIGKSVSVPLNEGKFSSAVTLDALEQKRVVTRFDDYPNGSRCLNTSTPIFDAKGDVWRVVACIRDMSELEVLQRGLADAERKNYLHDAENKLYHDDESRLIASSSVMRRCMTELERAAKAPSGILILGETGTGKTYAASWIHKRSRRADGPFIAVNCAAIPPSLIESELFGYDKGAFTGASRTGRKGYFELAHRGTLLLDEIGELPLNMQAKILHILDGQGFRKIGGEKEVSVDVRIIAATNRSLEQLVDEGSFRADLYYRLRVLSIHMPPLREHPQDIVPLMMFFLGQFCARHEISKTFSPKVIECFCKHSWPGNVRELRATVEFLATMIESSLIRLRDLPPWLMSSMGDARYEDDINLTVQEHEEDVTSAGSQLTYRQSIDDLERALISRALVETGSTYKAAARLGISQSTVVRKAKQFGIRLQERKASAKMKQATDRAI